MMAGTGKGRFIVPSLKEMEKMDNRPTQGMSRFAAHQLSKTSPQKSNNSDEQPSTSRAASISASIQHHGSTASTSVPKGKDISYGSTTTREGNTQKSSGIQSQSSLPDIRSNLVSTESRVQATTSTTGQTPALKEARPLRSHGTKQGAEGISVAGKSSSKTNSLIVNTRQKGNPIIKHIRNVLWEFGDIVPDYVMGQTTCALFLSLRYHALNPNYIHERFKQLGHSYALRVLLVQVDTKDPQHALRHLAKVCILADCTLILAWTPEEAGRYLETYKSFEVKPPDLIMEKTDSNYMSQLTDTLTAVKKVNKTDAMTLLTAFGSFEKIAEASEEDMSLCPGFGPQKAKRLHSAFHEPFISVKKSKTQESAAPAEKVAASPRKKKTDLS